MVVGIVLTICAWIYLIVFADYMTRGRELEAVQRKNGEYIPNHLAWSIFVTIFCFLPTGIVAIVHATKVKSLVVSGNMIAARNASLKARRWSFISVWIAIAFWSLVFMFSTCVQRQQEAWSQWSRVQEQRYERMVVKQHQAFQLDCDKLTGDSRKEGSAFG